MFGRQPNQPKLFAMISSFKTFAAAATVAAILSVSVSAASPGYVDFGKFEPDSGKQYVEVDINASLLRLAATFARSEEPEIANLLSSLERVRVNVFGAKEGARGETLSRVNTMRDKLVADGWNRIVTVREEAGDDVAVFVKENGVDAIHGVVVTVISGDGETVLVNVVGDVQMEQIARIGESLNIKHLRDLKLQHADTAPVES